MSMASSLSVGQSFNHSMQTIVDEGRAPAALEFRRVMDETRIGLARGGAGPYVAVASTRRISDSC